MILNSSEHRQHCEEDSNFYNDDACGFNGGDGGWLQRGGKRGGGAYRRRQNVFESVFF